MVLLISGDCMAEIKSVPDGSVDLVLADLPYDKTPAAHWDCKIPLVGLWSELRRVSKPESPMLFFAASPFNSLLMQSNPKEFRYEWVWSKNRGTGGMNAAYQPMRCHEFVLVFYKKRGVYNPQKTYGHKPYNAFKADDKNCGEIYGGLKSIHKGAPDGSRYPRSILEFPMERGHHSVQKPVPLLEYLINTYSNEGDVVFDPTMGSGSAGVAAANTKRKFVGIEKDPAIFNAAKKRIGA